MRRRVVITGMGVVTPLGNEVETMWERLLRGESGVSEISLFDAGTFPSRFAAQVRDFDYPEDFPESAVEQDRGAGRHSRFILRAAWPAWQQAQLPFPLTPDGSSEANGGVPPAERVGIYLGAGEGPLDFDRYIEAIVRGWDRDKSEMDWGRWSELVHQKLDHVRELEQEPNMAGAHLAKLFQLRGPHMSCLTACAASTQAIGEASELIRYDEADIVVSGGTHSMIHPLGLTGFNRLTALSTRNDSCMTASRPFDKERDGFVLAEGAGVVILEELESARRRGVEILAEVVGFGSTADAFRVTDQHDEGRGGIAAVRQALEDGQIAIDEIDYISAHGTGTQENDSIETHVIKTVFGERAYKIPISSVKSMIGHLIAAAGVVEFITCVLAIRDNIVPPTTNLANPDQALDLDYVPNKPRKHPVKTAMSNSFGFGGQNNTIIVREYQP